MPSPIKIFIAYARKDEELLAELRQHLTPLERSGEVSIWFDGKLEPGVVWEKAISDNLRQADIILLLISASSIASDYFYNTEMQAALQKHEEGSVQVIPLILRPCPWQITPIAKFQVLPKDGKAVTSWDDRHEAYTDAVNQLWEQIQKHKERQAAKVQKPLKEDLPPLPPIRQSFWAKNKNLIQLLIAITFTLSTLFLGKGLMTFYASTQSEANSPANTESQNLLDSANLTALDELMTPDSIASSTSIYDSLKFYDGNFEKKLEKRKYYLMVAVYAKETNAITLVNKLKKEGFPDAQIITLASSKYYSVTAGLYPDRNEAKTAKEKLKRIGYSSYIREP